MRLKRIGILGLLVLASIIGSAHAHDYWLAQEPLAATAGDTVMVRLLVGDELEAELERPLQRNITTRYEWHHDNDIVNLLEVLPDSTLPVFQRHVPNSETSLLVMDRDFVPIESTVERFLQFLEHEEMVDLVSRYQSVPPETPLRRRYARAIKALISTGGRSTDDLHSRTTDQTIEIRLLHDPSTSDAGTDLPIHVQLEGQDVPNLLVKAFVRGANGTVTVAKTRTDDAGIAHFALDRPGFWVLRTTLLRPSRSSEEADWDTYYATFSFVRR